LYVCFKEAKRFDAQCKHGNNLILDSELLAMFSPVPFHLLREHAPHAAI